MVATPSDGENRGSSPLGSANYFNRLALRDKIGSKIGLILPWGPRKLACASSTLPLSHCPERSLRAPAASPRAGRGK
jgi:hypothetical protein